MGGLRCLLVLLTINSIAAASRNKSDETSDAHHGIHVASWRWDEIGSFYTFTLFIIICGLAKIAFHHAHFLSAHVPESCLMIIVGVSVGAIIYFSSSGETMFIIPKFTPRAFFLILLPPVILEAAYSLYDRAFADNIGTVALYAVVGTLINTFSIGSLLYLLSKIGAMGAMLISPIFVANMRAMPYSLTLTDCFVFSALISAVDPVAVLAIFQEIGVNKDLYYLVFGESLLNDAVTVVLYTTMVTFKEMPTVPIEQYGLAIVAFFASSFGGLLIGILFGLLTALITRTTKEIRVVEPLAILGIAYLSYLSAELFHFSGIISIIGCGLVQAHYALRNVSNKSYTTVIYFTKMLSSTSDAIIFLFLGVVVVGDHHAWHTGFVLWSLLLCLVCRFAGVFLLTALANIFRVSQINLQEQFLMAYGGLRGAVAFSLVEMLDRKSVEPRQVLVTTTLVVIFFTVFIQGSTIKPLVNLLKIKRENSGKKTMSEEINENIISNVMAGIEEITGVRGDFYIRRKIDYIDEKYLQKIFLVDNQENDLTKLYKKLSLMEHYAHLYGPVALVEDHNTVMFRNETLPHEPTPHISATAADLIRRESFLMKDSDKTMSLSPGVELRRRTNVRTSVRTNVPVVDISNTDALRRAFRNHPHRKFPSRIPHEREQINEQLRLRHLTARCITALVNRQSLPVDHVSLPVDRQSLPAVPIDTSEALQRPRRLIHSELEDNYPDELEGMDAILDRASRRKLLRSVSLNSESYARTPTINRNVNQTLNDLEETEMDVFLPNK